MIDETISHFKILEKLGEGGMGVVYKALDTRLDRFVALKFLPDRISDDEEGKRRLIQEAKSASAINHPNVCVIYDIGEANGKQFIAMEYVDGVTLRGKFSPSPVLLRDAISYTVQIGDALHAAHSIGIVHRDVKPDNIMVQANGLVKVMDFGLAKLKHAILQTKSMSTAGTLAYMAPEQIQGADIDARADIFSLGVVLYEMLTRKLPFRGVHEAAMMYSILHEELDPIQNHLPDAPAELSHILRRSLEKESNDRYQSVQEMISDVRRLQSGSTSSVRPTGSLDGDASGKHSLPLDRLKKGFRNAMIRRSVAGAALLLLIAVSYLIFERPGTTSTQKIKLPAIPDNKSSDSVQTSDPSAGKKSDMELKKEPSAAIKRKNEAGAPAELRNENLASSQLSSATIVPPNEEPAAPASAGGYRIAVLPFSNISPEAKDEYFADGMTEELISTLSRIQGLRLIARTSVMQYKGAGKNVREIGRELNVKAVLEGSVRKSGNKLRISVQLIDATNQEHLWSEEYDRELTDVFVIQGNVAQRVAEALQVQLVASEKQQIGKSWTGNVEAYTLYLRGRYYWNKRSPPDLLQSVEYFKKAAQQDPRYALAFAGLADAYTLLGNYYVLSPSDAYPKAKAAALQALEIDESLAEAHTSLAFALMHFDWDWPGAEKEFKRAVELNPSYVVGESWYAYFLTVTGRFDEAVVLRKRAQELDPFSLVVSSDVGLTLYFARKYEETVEQFHKTLASDPSFTAAYIPLGAALLHLHRNDEAIAAFKKARAFSQNHPIPSAALAYAYAVSGKREEALAIVAELKKLSATAYVSSYWIGIIYAGLDDEDAAFEWLGKGIADHDGSMIFLKVEPILDRLRQDKRFAGLLANVRLNN